MGYSLDVVILIKEFGQERNISLMWFDDTFYQCTSLFNDLCGGKDKKWDKMKTIHLSKTILLTNVIRNKNNASYIVKICPSIKRK